MSDYSKAAILAMLQTAGESVLIGGEAVTAIVQAGAFQTEEMPGLIVYSMSIMVRIVDCPTPQPDVQVILSDQDEEIFYIQPRASWQRRPGWWVLPLYKDEFA